MSKCQVPSSLVTPSAEDAKGGVQDAEFLRVKLSISIYLCQVPPAPCPVSPPQAHTLHHHSHNPETTARLPANLPGSGLHPRPTTAARGPQAPREQTATPWCVASVLPQEPLWEAEGDRPSLCACMRTHTPPRPKFSTFKGCPCRPKLTTWHRVRQLVSPQQMWKGLASG